MPPETRNYVPKLQALKNIINDPKPFGIVLDPIPNQPYFVSVDGTGAIDVRLAAKLAEMPVDDFIALNPGFNRPLIPTSLDSRIVLPADKVEVFRANLEKYDDKARVSWKTYRPQRGERLDHIARKFHLSLAELKKVNGIRSRSLRAPGLLVVPIDGAKLERHAAADHVRAAHPGPPARPLYRVRRGDTLWGISRRYRVSVAVLAAPEPPRRHASSRAAHRGPPAALIELHKNTFITSNFNKQLKVFSGGSRGGRPRRRRASRRTARRPRRASAPA